MYAQLNSVNPSVIRALDGFRRKGIVSGPLASLNWETPTTSIIRRVAR